MTVKDGCFGGNDGQTKKNQEDRVEEQCKGLDKKRRKKTKDRN